MPINRVAKGQRKERTCELELQAKGYMTWKTIRHKFLNIDLSCRKELWIWKKRKGWVKEYYE